jgi:DNA polymerase III epsilon subunit-like protein
MKLLFFDMEFADGKVEGSIYSLGYLMTDEDFHILIPPTDLLINPDSTWNEYVEKNILAYPKDEVESAPKFFELYDRIKVLFSQADIAVGFAVGNDTRALRQDCARYGLEQIQFRCFDTEKLCRKMDEHKDAHGLAGYVRAWCGEDPSNQHRSDGDAFATMMLMRAICCSKHALPEMLLLAYPECVVDVSEKTQKKKHAESIQKSKSSKKRHWYRKRSQKVSEKGS